MSTPILENVHHCRLPFVPNGNSQHFLLYQTNAVESLIFASLFNTEGDRTAFHRPWLLKERPHYASSSYSLSSLGVTGSALLTWSHDALTCQRCTCMLIDIVHKECVIQNDHHVGLRFVLPHFAFSILSSLVCRQRECFSGRVPGTKARAQWCVVWIIRSGTNSDSTNGPFPT